MCNHNRSRIVNVRIYSVIQLLTETPESVESCPVNEGTIPRSRFRNVLDRKNNKIDLRTSKRQYYTNKKNEISAKQVDTYYCQLIFDRFSQSGALANLSHKVSNGHDPLECD